MKYAHGDGASSRAARMSFLTLINTSRPLPHKPSAPGLKPHDYSFREIGSMKLKLLSILLLSTLLS
ncbi:hypothetical protein, partial [Zoogloea sp.]|uniref:hypothetical protein n=1 Tax=Zoogloea sp. TaxID=49181 RepID=UPI0025F9C855